LVSLSSVNSYNSHEHRTQLKKEEKPICDKRKRMAR